MSIAVRGVCCACQQPQELRERPAELDVDDDADLEAVGLRVEAEQYVVASHFAHGGSICDGSGSVPQAIVR